MKNSTFWMIAYLLMCGAYVLLGMAAYSYRQQAVIWKGAYDDFRNTHICIEVKDTLHNRGGGGGGR